MNVTTLPVTDQARASRGIRLHHLRLRGFDRDYGISFLGANGAVRGLSIVAGRISTGKTAALEFIDYCLGASRHPQHPEILRKVRSAALQVDFTQGARVIERTVSAASSTASVHQGSLSSQVWDLPESRVIAPAGDPSSLSSMLLAACGLEGVQLREAPTRADSKTDPLSFRDLMWLCFLTNDRMASPSLLFEGEGMKALKLRQVVDVVFDVHDEPSIDLGARVQELETWVRRSRTDVQTLERFLEEQPTPALLELDVQDSKWRSQLVSSGERLAVVNAQARSATDFAEELRARHSEAADAARSAATRLRYRETQLRRLASLRAQYADDSRKLQFLNEADVLFNELQVKVCPACLTPLPHAPTIAGNVCGLCHQQVDVHMPSLSLSGAAMHADGVPEGPGRLDDRDGEQNETGFQSADSGAETSAATDRGRLTRELRAVKTRLSELNRYCTELETQLTSLRREAEAAAEAEREAATALDNAVSSVLSPYMAERDELLRRAQEASSELDRVAAAQRMWQGVERRKLDLERQEARLKELRAHLREVQGLRVDRNAVISKLSIRFQTLLEAFRYPKLTNAYLDAQLVPHVRGGLYRDQSSGAKTLLSLAWQLAIFEEAYEGGAYHPGFLMIDSPQKNLGGRGSGADYDPAFQDAAIVDGLYRHLTSWLAGPGSGAQIVVADNTPPPLVESAVVVRFTGDPRRPPYGLIEDETE